MTATKALTYTNPVFPGYFADPFVLKVTRHSGSGNAMYYAYGTGHGIEPDGRWCPVLHSEDLVHWTYLGGAITPLDPPHQGYWAPEVAERDGRFYLYYSAASGATDDTQQLRVAVSDRPEGPFVTEGGPIIPAGGFNIDAHPFRDPVSGEWFLYYACDFFDERVGTGTAVARLRDDMLGVVGEPRVVLRAQHDWQIYERNRHHYGKDWSAWHTVEGPFVLHRQGKYVCLYSGGPWHAPDYGVSFGVADHPLGPFTDDGSAHGPAVLKGAPDRGIVGPGHCSVVTLDSPAGQPPTDLLVYHAWDAAKTARRMCLDPLVWTPQGPRCPGPTNTPQPLLPAGS